MCGAKSIFLNYLSFLVGFLLILGTSLCLVSCALYPVPRALIFVSASVFRFLTARRQFLI